MIFRFPRTHTYLLILLAWLWIAPHPVQAHAVILQAKPAANDTVPGPDLSIRLRFNSRIDGTRSRITLVLPDKSEREAKIEEQQSPEILSSVVKGLPSGDYLLRWQVLAADGHITRGEYSFKIQ